MAKLAGAADEMQLVAAPLRRRLLRSGEPELSRRSGGRLVRRVVNLTRLGLAEASLLGDACTRHGAHTCVAGNRCAAGGRGRSAVSRERARFRIATIEQSGPALSLVVHLISVVERRSRACSFENAEVELESDKRELRDRIAR